ncbi:uncharacterized protein OCT59_014422 [Rhizophagus irregularis]|uniref:uncharacterized protein n=1 Tax=Rhizophagus irregularis TaxID=588596 RepID=UPI0033244652|nr:hypothetical protein OCT59_014422 [Rhizophagus irregularis]
MIDNYEGKDDCFKEAAFMIKNECSKLEDISNDERSIYTIKLTLCQLRTAGFDTPSQCDDLTNYSDCLASIGSINQYWVTYDGFLREVEILYQHRKNISSYYENMMNNLSIIVASIRNEELEQLPHITESLKSLNHEISVIKQKSYSVYKEMNTVKNDLKKPYYTRCHKSFSDELSNVSLKKISEIKENLSGVVEMTDDSRIVQEDLNSSIRKTKVELEVLLEFSKNEIGNIMNSINYYKKTLDIFVTFTDYKYLIIFEILST